MSSAVESNGNKVKDSDGDTNGVVPTAEDDGEKIATICNIESAEDQNAASNAQKWASLYNTFSYIKWNVY